MDRATEIELLEYLSGFITDHKLRRFEQVLAQRTRHATVVLEDIFQPHNASATIRSCDLFGVQDLHVIEMRNRYTVNPGVAVGASKWVNLIRYGKRGEDNTTRCFQDLKEKGYRIVATTPHRDDVLIDELDITSPYALVFGTEETGLSETALDLADEYVRIPQVGFTESFNISVSVALCLYETTRRLRASSVNWRLSDEEIFQLRLAWARKVVRNSAMLEKEYLAGRGR